MWRASSPAYEFDSVAAAARTELIDDTGRAVQYVVARSAKNTRKIQKKKGDLSKRSQSGVHNRYHVASKRKEKAQRDGGEKRRLMTRMTHTAGIDSVESGVSEEATTFGSPATVYSSLAGPVLAHMFDLRPGPFFLQQSTGTWVAKTSVGQVPIGLPQLAGLNVTGSGVALEFRSGTPAILHTSHQRSRYRIENISSL